MKKQLLSIEDFKNLNVGSKIEVHTLTKTMTATVFQKHDNGDLDTDVTEFGDDILIRAEKVLSGNSKVVAIYEIQQ